MSKKFDQIQRLFSELCPYYSQQGSSSWYTVINNESRKQAVAQNLQGTAWVAAELKPSLILSSVIDNEKAISNIDNVCGRDGLVQGNDTSNEIAPNPAVSEQLLAASSPLGWSGTCMPMVELLHCQPIIVNIIILLRLLSPGIPKFKQNSPNSTPSTASPTHQIVWNAQLCVWQAVNELVNGFKPESGILGHLQHIWFISLTLTLTMYSHGALLTLSLEWKASWNPADALNEPPSGSMGAAGLQRQTIIHAPFHCTGPIWNASGTGSAFQLKTLASINRRSGR